jgi:hypothetical protein
MKSGSNFASSKAPLPPGSRENAHGVNKSIQKAFKPLRHEGRLGAAISSDRKAYLSNPGRSLNSGLITRGGGSNYKSITSIGSGSKNGIPKSLLKSKSQAKNLQPLPDE